MSRILRKISNFVYRKIIGPQILVAEGDVLNVIDGNRVWLISDMHFGHKGIIKWCRSNVFKNLHEMHKVLISNWNSLLENMIEYSVWGFWKFQIQKSIAR